MIFKVLPPPLEDVNSTLYLTALLFEALCAAVVIFLSIKAGKRYRIRKQKATLALMFLYISIGTALILTAMAKFLFYTFEISFNSAHFFDKLALIGMIGGNLFLLKFDFEIFLNLEIKKQRLYIAAYGVLTSIPVILEILSPAEISVFTSVFIMIANLPPYLIHIYYAGKLKKKTSNFVEKGGITLIFYQGISQLSYLIILAIGSGLRAMNLLPRFNFTYFLRFICLVLALLLSYFGYFLPDWLKKRLKKE